MQLETRVEELKGAEREAREAREARELAARREDERRERDLRIEELEAEARRAGVLEVGRGAPQGAVGSAWRSSGRSFHVQ